MRRHAKEGSVTWFFLMICMGFFLSSCGSVLPPQRTVYIPPPYQKYPSSTQHPADRAQPRQDAYQSPVLQPAPEISERDSSSSVPEDYSMPSETSRPSQSVRPVEPQPEPKAAPQQLASMRIVDQAKASMEQGDVDHAISLLEQAIQVDVYNGDAFYGLAQAWRMKGAFDRALEFSNKAEVIYKNNPSKLKRLYLFEADVYTVLQEYEKAAVYRQKASQL